MLQTNIAKINTSFRP